MLISCRPNNFLINVAFKLLNIISQFKINHMRGKNIQAIRLFLIVVFMITLVSCDPSKKYREEEQSQIQSYLNSNTSLNFELKTSGLYYLEVTAGTGLTPGTHDTAYLKYTGSFLDGVVFSTNVGKTDTLIFPFNENVIIPGIEEGVGYMKVGGKSKLLVPSDLAYGTAGYNIIPGYTPLLFDIELVRVKPGSGK
jgi:FKBP-type peptidyl-prolyl cis-trans isomerase